MADVTIKDLETEKKKTVKLLYDMARTTFELNGEYHRIEIYSTKHFGNKEDAALYTGIYYFLFTGTERDIAFIHEFTQFHALNDEHMEKLKKRNGFLGQILRAETLDDYKALLHAATAYEPEISPNVNRDATIKAFNAMKNWLVQEVHDKLVAVFDPSKRFGNNDLAHFLGGTPGDGPSF